MIPKNTSYDLIYSKRIILLKLLLLCFISNRINELTNNQIKELNKTNRIKFEISVVTNLVFSSFNCFFHIFFIY